MFLTLEQLEEQIQEIVAEIKKRVYGMDEIIEYVLMALFAGGHIILQGVPGTAKTRLLKAVAEVLGIDFERIQMTVDLLPADITGQEIMTSSGELKFRKGPVFTQLLLADELNRTTPKTKASLLEALAERRVTIPVESEESGKRTIELDEVFTVFATQNPLEQLGTYPLGEAEADRFMMKKKVGYVDKESELLIAKRPRKDVPLREIMNAEEILAARDLIWKNVHIEDEMYKKIRDVIRHTRPGEESDLAVGKLKVGASPRASETLPLVAKVRALLNGRKHVIPRDIFELTYPVICHRVVFESPRKEEWEGVLKDLLDEIFKKVFKGEYENAYSDES